MADDFSYEPSRDEEDMVGSAESWDHALSMFYEHVFPVFSKHGLTRNTALQVYMTNRLYNALWSVFETLDEDGET